VATQEELYARLGPGEVDRALSWAEHELPERERTKHVHKLHPYLGKFVPQLVETCLERHFAPGRRVLDPFAGSGTTLVEASVFGCDAVGVDISAFNVLLSRVKTGRHDAGRIEATLNAALAGLDDAEPAAATPWLGHWYHADALRDLLRYRALIPEAGDEADVMRVVLSRAARSARLAPHFRLESPLRPQTEPYWCYKHRRTCTPTTDARQFLRSYTADTVTRLRAYAALRRDVQVAVVHGDARTAELPATADGIITSPPYPGRIDYHEQHRYAYELLGLPERRAEEIGAPANGRSRRAIAEYCAATSAVFANSRRFLSPGAPCVIVVHDDQGLYDGILQAAGLEPVSRTRRHVNRRTGRRSPDYFESVIVARAA
jgi:hypothetical protein